MKKTLSLLFALTALCACSDNDQFRVNGTIEGNPTMNLRVGYYADGAYRTAITAAHEGKFEFFGNARQSAIVEIYDYEYRPLGRVFAKNGETLELTLDRAKPYAIEAKGNETTREWAQFLRNNADSLAASPQAANRAVERYIAANRGNILSTILLTTHYNSRIDPEMADSLLGMIEASARPSYLTDGYNALLQRVVAETAKAPVLPLKYIDKNEATGTFRPDSAATTLMVFENADGPHTDSIVPMLRRLHADKKVKAALVEISFDGQLGDFKRLVTPDSAAWTQAWVPGGPASINLERLAVPSLPFYIVCDSTGTQLLRTKYAHEAEDYVKNL